MTSDYELLLSVLYFSGNHIEGRKRFQKKVCILKYGYNVPFTFEFVPYYYGPFSNSLADAIDTLVGLGYVEEKRSDNYGLLQYEYSLTSFGQEFISKRIKQMKIEDPNFHKILSSYTKELSQMNTSDLVSRSKLVTQDMYNI